MVEDDLDTVQSLAFLLKHDGHIVEFAINGYVAINIAKRFRPDVVLLDIGLPGLDGFEVCARLRSEPELKNIPIVAVTACSSEADRDRIRAAGCDLYMSKPYDPQRLLAVVRHLA